MIDESNLKQALKHFFGYETFKVGQRAIIQAVLQKQDTLGVLPTGTGKSLCYQLPTYLLNKPSLIVTPLIALMQDQVTQLNYQGEKRAIALNSELNRQEKKRVLQTLKQYRFIYISPEMLLQPEILAALQAINWGLFVIDEAHCISQWGVDFRPDYLKLAAIKKSLSHHATLALTATATPNVQKDIQQKLGFHKTSQLITTSVDRPNIYLKVKTFEKPQLKKTYLINQLQQTVLPGIIYASSRQSVMDLAALIKQETTLKVAYYHGGLSTKERFMIQQRFMADQLDIICATNAFSMGINKENIRFVIHYHTPQNLESYLQEIGRAGRDQKPSYALLLSDESDFHLQNRLLTYAVPDANLIETYQKKPDQFSQYDDPKIALLKRYHLTTDNLASVKELFAKTLRNKQQGLTEMFEYVGLDTCRRQYLIDHFDQQPQQVHTQTRCCDQHDDQDDLPDFKNNKNQNEHENAVLTDWKKVLKRLFL